MNRDKTQEQKGLYADPQWGEVRSSILRQYIDTDKQNVVTDQVLIQQQSELMEQIKQKIKKSRMKDVLGSMEVLPIDSSISNISSAYNYGDDQSLIKNKFTQEFQSSLVNSALKEVKNSCSDETYETVRNYIMNNKQKQCENLTKTLEKKNKEIEELSLSIIMKQNQLVKLKEEIAPYIAKAQYFQEEKKKLKKKTDQNMEKQMMLHKIERTLIFKQKMLQQAKKRSQKLKQFYDGIFSRMRKVEQDLNNVRIDIEKKMEKAEEIKCCNQSDQNLCWKKQVMKKFRQKLLQERNILKQEQKQLQKRYQALEIVSDQCKKLVNQSYEGIVSTFGSGNSSINVGLKEQKSQKASSYSMMSPQVKRFVV